MSQLGTILNNPELNKYSDKFASSVLPSVKIDVAYPESILPYTTSKFGGKPFVYDASSYPNDPHGNQLVLLAQINFAEVPNLENFPKEGLLQFFVSTSELSSGSYGANRDMPNDQSYFRIIYLNPDLVKEENAVKYNIWPVLQGDHDFPINNELALSFSYKEDVVPMHDYRFEKVIGCSENDLEVSLKNFDLLDELTSNNENKLGGYPHFIQGYDIRSLKNNEKYDTTLLQITSQNTLNKEWEINWGDVGTANFFINKEKLNSLDFSDVIFTWDCC